MQSFETLTCVFHRGWSMKHNQTMSSGFFITKKNLINQWWIPEGGGGFQGLNDLKVDMVGTPTPFLSWLGNTPFLSGVLGTPFLKWLDTPLSLDSSTCILKCSCLQSVFSLSQKIFSCSVMSKIIDSSVLLFIIYTEFWPISL